MKTRLSISLAALSTIAVLAGCRLSDRPPWTPTPATSQNPYGKQFAAQRNDPSANPFLQNGQQYAARNGNHHVGRVTIPSAGHPIASSPYGSNHNGVMQAGYQTPAQPSHNYRRPMQPMRTYQPPRQPQQPNVFQPGPHVSPMPRQQQWQPHQPQVHQPQTMGSQDQSPFVPSVPSY